jgi:F-type H+-transporting ATPase subunit delta
VAETTQHENVLDIGAEQLGKTYARALLGAAVRENASEQVLDQLRAIVTDALGDNPKLAAAFESPRVSAAEKARIIDRLFGNSIHPILLRLMKVMADRGRLGYLNAVSRAADVLHDEVTGRVVAEVRTAVPLSDDLRNDVARRLSQSLGKQVRLKESVDSALVGGMVIRVGDTVYDSSVASRIDKIGRAARDGFARQLLQQSDRFVSGV